MNGDGCTKSMLEKGYMIEMSRIKSKLSELEVGSEEYTHTLDCMNKVSNQLIECEERAIEDNRNEQAANNNARFKQEELRLSRRSKIGDTVVTVLKWVGGAALTGAFAIMSFNYEKNGIITSEPGKSTLRELLNFKNLR